MRLAGQAKAGFYPAPVEAVKLTANRLVCTDLASPILDPCAGKGHALNLLAEELGVQSDMVYAIELDEGRGDELRLTLGTAGNVLAPASFLGCRATPGSFSLIWCNPPFDDETGGGRRCEYSFLQRATGWLRVGGIIALVCPEDTAKSYDVRRQLCTWFDQVTMRPFPEDCRKYDEVIVLGIKRDKPAKVDEYSCPFPWAITDPETVYPIPPGLPPKMWEKYEMTELELLTAMDQSPLRKMLVAPPELPLPTPPLALGTGHIALLLAAGHLDGVVRPDNEPPHVVRGTASKITYLSSTETTEDAKGNETVKEVFSEKIILTVRAVDQEGTIHTFKQE